MVYQEMNQLKRYHFRPDTFLTTSGHFHDNPSLKESPSPSDSQHKVSTHGKLYNGSLFFNPVTGARATSTGTWRKGNLHSTADLDKAPPPRQQIPSLSPTLTTYRGNGNFTVELPHSTITYRNPGMVNYNLLAWKSEYSDKYVSKKGYPGYSTLSTRRFRPQTAQF